MNLTRRAYDVVLVLRSVSIILQRKKLRALSRVELYERQIDLLKAKQGGTDSHCIGAYVVFNNEESALRCIDDYKYA